jgi:hypothetical protein
MGADSRKEERKRKCALTSTGLLMEGLVLLGAMPDLFEAYRHDWGRFMVCLGAAL